MLPYIFTLLFNVASIDNEIPKTWRNHYQSNPQKKNDYDVLNHNVVRTLICTFAEAQVLVSRAPLMPLRREGELHA